MRTRQLWGGKEPGLENFSKFASQGYLAHKNARNRKALSAFPRRVPSPHHESRLGHGGCELKDRVFSLLVSGILSLLRDTAAVCFSVQGYLAHKKPPRPSTLQ